MIYNNVFFFCNEVVIVDKKNNIFNTFRVMNEIKHLLEVMFVEKNDVKKFCQIYQMNSFQNIIERRLNLNEDLKQKKLLLLTRLMKNVNFYVETYKICDDRFRDEFNFQTRFVLKQNELDCLSKNIHNKFTFDEIVAFIILFEIMNSNHVLKRDIVIQKQNDDLRFVFYWHVVYMSFRYSLLFFHDEQSWNVKISFRDFENCKKLFARRAASNNFFRHNVFFNNENQIDSEQFETKLNFLQNKVTVEFDAKKKTTMLR